MTKFRTPELDAEFAQHKENSLILLAPRWGAPEIETLPGVARFARSPLANLLARLRRAERSPEGCGEISPGWSEATPGV